MTTRFAPWLVAALAMVVQSAAQAGPDPKTYWNVDDLKPGMEGDGRTVIHGTKIETFKATVLGVLKNTSPGRDMVLARLAGLDLERTGVIAGMSGSPVYIQGKLLGAVAYAWPYGKEPIAGITPFAQMHGFVETFERRDLAERDKPVRVGLREPLRIDGRDFTNVSVAQSTAAAKKADDDLWMTPLQTPLSASGFTAHSLKMLQDAFPGNGLLPVQGGSAPGKVLAEEKDVKLEAGGALTVALITGDFDMSGIGTVTHVEDKRVYGWGHPFLSLGGCEFPLMTGYVVTVYPRQSVSFKMGSPLKTVGVINADVSTCIAGWLDKTPDMLPVSMTVRREPGGETHRFNVQIVRQKQLLPSLVYAALTNSVDMHGDLPEEMTAVLQCRIEMEGKDPIVIKDTYAGPAFASGRAPGALYSPVASILNQIASNPFEPVRFTKIECETEIHAGRRSAEIEGVELAADTVAPGQVLKASVYMKPYKGQVQKVPVSLKIPADLPDGSYQATICDDLASTRSDLRGQPQMLSPQTLDQALAAVRQLTTARRTTLAIRVPMPAAGVALDGQALPNLPPSAVQMLGQTRRTSVQPVITALVEKKATPWVVYGSETIRFTVSRTKAAALVGE